MQEVASHPKEAVALLKEKLKPVALSSAQIKKWIADLDSKNFATREKAVKELEKIAETIETGLHDALDKSASAEAHLRLKMLLEKLPQKTPSPERLKQMRALELLEQLDTPEARALLQTLAQGTPEAWLSQEAKKILQRLKE
jgi:hypothetical protein